MNYTKNLAKTYGSHWYKFEYNDGAGNVHLLWVNTSKRFLAIKLANGFATTHLFKYTYNHVLHSVGGLSIVLNSLKAGHKAIITFTHNGTAYAAVKKYSPNGYYTMVAKAINTVCPHYGTEHCHGCAKSPLSCNGILQPSASVAGAPPKPVTAAPSAPSAAPDKPLDNLWGDVSVEIISYGISKGTLHKPDLVVSALDLKNPYRDPNLRPLNGTNDKVRAFVSSDPAFIGILGDAIKKSCATATERLFSGDKTIRIGVACFGGSHRSVVLATVLGEELAKEGFSVRVKHRDIRRD